MVFGIASEDGFTRAGICPFEYICVGKILGNFSHSTIRHSYVEYTFLHKRSLLENIEHQLLQTRAARDIEDKSKYEKILAMRCGGRSENVMTLEEVPVPDKNLKQLSQTRLVPKFGRENLCLEQLPQT